jgi:two-component system sensor histidine kinase YesM
MGKQKSMFIKLIVPICLVTTLFWVCITVAFSAIYTHQAENNAVQTSQEILNQTATSLQIIHSHVSKVAQDITETNYMHSLLAEDITNIYQEWDNRRRISALFSNSPNTMFDYDIIVVGRNGIAMSSGVGGVNYNAKQIFELPVYKEAAQKGYIAYTSLQGGLTYSTKNEKTILGCRVLKEADGTPYGGVMISIREPSMRHFYQNFARNGTDIILMEQDGTVLSAQDTSLVGTSDRNLLQAAKKNRADKVFSSHTADGHIVVSQYIPYFNAYMISQITSAVLMKDFYRARMWLVLLFNFVLILLVITIAWILRRNLRPLQYLAVHMASTDSLPPRPVNIPAVYELQVLTTAYNGMIQKLDEYLAELDIAYAKRRQYELDLLQMQINPHFLYNTLSSIKHLVGMNSSEQVCSMIDSLIGLLRSTLGKSDMLVSVKDEITNVKNYINIVSPRYGGLITAQVNVDAACFEYKIPNLLLQPFVENAFFHAFQNTKSGSIHIFISMSGTNICCEILDNGDGIAPELVHRLLTGDHGRQSSVNHIGVYNVRERLQMLYPEHSTFRIVSELGYGTSVQITFPAQGSSRLP